MNKKNGEKGKNRKPMVTRRVAVGLEQLMKHIPAALLVESSDALRAFVWMSEWKEYLESEEYTNRSKAQVEASRKYKRN